MRAWRELDATTIAEHLAKAPVFAPLDPRDRLELAGRMRQRQYRRNEVVFHREDPAGHVYLIVSGTVKISVPEEDGHEVVVALARSGDVVGELALFDEGPRSATVTALSDTSVFALANKDFLSVLERSPRAMRELLALLASRIRRSTTHIEDLVFLDLPGRVAKCLLDQSELAADGVVNLTQEDLASFVGATRVATNRVLVDFERRGAVRLGRGQIEIVDRDILKREVRS